MNLLNTGNGEAEKHFYHSYDSEIKSKECRDITFCAYMLVFIWYDHAIWIKLLIKHDFLRGGGIKINVQMKM